MGTEYSVVGGAIMLVWNTEISFLIVKHSRQSV